jgi:hypothetical protein
MQAAWRACFLWLPVGCQDIYIFSHSFFCKSSLKRISGITNQKQTGWETIDIVQSVSSSLPIRMDLTRQTLGLVGFFFATRSGYPPIDLISIN